MRSRSSVSLALLLAGCGGGGAQLPPAPLASRVASPEPAQPSGRSDEQAYDRVGLASWYGEEAGDPTASGARFDANAIIAAHRTLTLGSAAEVTSLDTGRTVLVLVTDRGPGRTDREIDLSRGAAKLLGTDTRPVAAVRVRSVVASPADLAALNAGRPASPRLDAPPVVLAALRRQLKGYKPAAKAAASPTQRWLDQPIRPRQAASAGGYAVQVAAFSGEGRARALAKALGGEVVPAGALYRVRLGPFASVQQASRARDAAAARGYGDARIIPADQ